MKSIFPLLLLLILLACDRVKAQETLGPTVPLETAPAENLALVRGPYLQQVSASSAILRWTTNKPCKGRVVFHMVSDKPTVELHEKANDNAKTLEHEILLKGLLPNTSYAYAVQSNGLVLANAFGKAVGQFKTAPRTGDDVPVRFWVIGDSGTANRHAAAVYRAFLADAKDKPADLWLMLGDNAYGRGTAAEYQKAVFDMYPGMLRNCCLWPTFGNHDAYSASSAKQSGPYYDFFTLPTQGECGGVPSGTEAYYAFDHGPVHFICLDSQDTNRKPDGAMAKWLQADLDANLSAWTIVFFHHPPYTKGSHDSDDPRDSDGRLKDMREIFLPMLEKAGVDLVLCGHSHSYERSYLLNGHYGDSKTLTKEMIKDAGDGDPDNPAPGGAYDKKAHPQAEVCVVAGSSGKISGGTLNHPAMHCSLNMLGSLVVEINGKKLEAKFLTDKGEVKDRFVIEKGGAGLVGQEPPKPK